MLQFKINRNYIVIFKAVELRCHDFEEQSNWIAYVITDALQRITMSLKGVKRSINKATSSLT